MKVGHRPILLIRVASAKNLQARASRAVSSIHLTMPMVSATVSDLLDESAGGSRPVAARVAATATGAKGGRRLGMTGRASVSTVEGEHLPTSA